MRLSAFAFDTIRITDSVVMLTQKSEEAWLTLQGGDIRYRYDGDEPTKLEGHILHGGHGLRLVGESQVQGFRAIAVGENEAILSVSYERV